MKILRFKMKHNGPQLQDEIIKAVPEVEKANDLAPEGVVCSFTDPETGEFCLPIADGVDERAIKAVVQKHVPK